MLLRTIARDYVIVTCQECSSKLGQSVSLQETFHVEEVLACKHLWPVPYLGISEATHSSYF